MNYADSLIITSARNNVLSLPFLSLYRGAEGWISVFSQTATAGSCKQLIDIFMKLTFTFLAAVFISLGALAQGNVKITGTVFDSLTQRPVEFANVALVLPSSSTPIDGTVCNEKGEFTLSKIPVGKYQLLISFIGFETRTIDVSVDEKNHDVNVGRIIISPTPQVLEAVTVEGQKALIEERVDRMVYNAENDLTTRGGDATDVLKRVPMLSVDLDGNVSLRGNQNIMVLINNKPSSIVASSVSDALKQIPADEIKSVEVITSPSAKYDAEGSAGIINIITKKNTLHGLTLNINSGIGLRGSNLGLMETCGPVRWDSRSGDLADPFTTRLAVLKTNSLRGPFRMMVR